MHGVDYSTASEASSLYAESIWREHSRGSREHHAIHSDQWRQQWYPSASCPATRQHVAPCGRLQNQVANHHYAAYLGRAEPGLLAGVVNADLAQTGIYRHSPWYARGLVALAGPLFFNSVEESAHNAVHACLRDDWPTATFWEKPGAFERRSSIMFDETATPRIIDASRKITGV